MQIAKLPSITSILISLAAVGFGAPWVRLRKSADTFRGRASPPLTAPWPCFAVVCAMVGTETA
jgi:hypothetical protein